MMDPRIRAYLEDSIGLPFDSFPASGISFLASEKRADEPEQRLRLHHLSHTNGVLVTGVPAVIGVVEPAIGSLSTWELFSPLGMAELRRALGSDFSQHLFHGFAYTLLDTKDFRPAENEYEVITLKKADIPPEQLESRMAELSVPPTDDFVWAFTCYHEDEQAAIAFLRRESPPGYVTISVETREEYRRKGYGIAVVSAATQWVLEQGAVAHYGTMAGNIPSLRIARRLGYAFTYEVIGA